MTAENLTRHTLPTITLAHISDSLDPTDCRIDIRGWPFVPRVGEDIQISCDEHGHHYGRVRVVMWGDDGDPLVRYR